MSDARNRILERVKAALGDRGSVLPQPVSITATHNRLQWPEITDKVGLFTTRLQQSGGVVQFINTKDELRTWIRTFLSDLPASRAVISRAAIIQHLDIQAMLDANSCKTSFSGDGNNFSTMAEKADIGIGTAVAGFAENGSILVAATEHEPRTLSLLPQAHLALLRERDLFPSMDEYSHQIKTRLEKQGSSALTFIGGPSKTADIEKTLVQGVHGPRIFAVAILSESIDT